MEKRIDDQFEVIKRLGEGLSGEVFHVRKDGKDWALKLLKKAPDAADAEGWIDAFKFEFSLLKDIQHPNVVAIGDFGWDPKLDRLYYTQEFLRGIPLQLFLDGAPFEKAEALFRQCLEGLEAIHNAPALHGDLKSSNIFVVNTPKGPQAKILDLGMAHPKLTGSGTPATMAPEKVLGDVVDERSDLYALAVCFYEALTSTNPFLRETPAETLTAQTTVTPAPVGTLNHEVPPSFAHLLMQLLSKNPRDRPRSARAVLNELKLAHGEALESSPTEAVASERWVGREEIREAVRAWYKTAKRLSLLAVTGDQGLGKSRLLQEMKYEIELEGLARDIALADAPQDWDNALSRLAPSVRGVLAAVRTQDLAALQEAARRRNILLETVALKGFTPDDIRSLIGLSSRHEKSDIPMTLAMTLFEETKGHPGATVALLSALGRRKRLLDADGRWNLAVFREGGMDWKALLSNEAASGGVSAGPDDDSGRATFLLQKMRDLLRAGEREEIPALIADCEAASKKVENRELRLKLRAEIWERKTWSAILGGRFAEALGAIEAAKAVLEEAATPDPALTLRLLNFEAFATLRLGRPDEAISQFEATHRRWETELSEEQKAQVVNNDLAAALMQKGEYDRAIKIQTEYLHFFEGIGDEAQAARAHYQLGECHVQSSSFKKAVAHYQAAATGARRLKKWDLLLRAYNGLGTASNHLHKPHEGIEHYRRALDLARYLKDYAAAAAVAQNIGAIQKDLDQFETARENLELSLKLLSQLKETSLYANSLRLRADIELAELARERSDFETARDLLSEAKRLVASDKSFESYYFFVYQSLSLLALDQGRFDEFGELYPDLLYHAKTPEQKERVVFLRKRSPVDPGLPRESAPSPAAPVAPHKTIPSHTPSDEGSWLKAVLEINQSLLTEKEPDRLLTLVLRHALALSSAESGVVLLVDEAGRLSVASSMNIEVSEDLSQISRGVAERVLREGRPLKTDNATQDGDFQAYRSVHLLGLKSIFAAPIRAGQKNIGVLYLIHRFRPALFDDRTERILQAFADQAGLAIENARLVAALAEKNKDLEHELETVLREGGSRREAYPEIISQSPAMEKVFGLLDRISASNLSVMIRGESGTGKELIARALHQNSSRRTGKFIAINCGALPANLIESELFGYKAGAFTDARTDKKGLLEEAHGGTIFLDEIGDLDVALQVKLLRVLQERQVVRLGDSVPASIDVRVVSATHQDVHRRISEGKFREDLFYRIAEIQVELPPLRDRKEDLPALIRHFLEKFAAEQKMAKIPKISRELMKTFLAYPWPGNIRELGNRVRVACALSDGKILQLADLPETDRLTLSEPSHALPRLSPSPQKSASPTFNRAFVKDMLEQGKSWREIETIVMAKALTHFDYDVARAAKSLNIGSATLYNRLRSQRLRRRREEFAPLAFLYSPDTSLDDFKREVFRAALQLNDEKPYHAARQLKVSPGMLYRWV